jgi:pimeloyl-ACP methyl ester carboxylesterase
MTAVHMAYQDIYFTARDGLRLHARRYAAVNSQGSLRRPLLCLAGLTRNGRDFHDLAMAIAGHESGSRDVYTLDYRGRGLSQSDTDWRHYSVPVEMLDVLDFMTLMGLHGAAVIGTSRGGLIAMLMAAVQPTAIGAAVLNDIGPVIDPAGLGRITAYVGRMPIPGSWAEATKLVQDMSQRAFPAVADEEWESVARQWFNERKGRPAPGYDPALANAISVLDGPMPELWPQFEALKRVPLLVLRGERSDILSKETVEEMRRRHPAFSAVTVKGQGHAPLLKDKTTIEVIRRFLGETEAVQSDVLRCSEPLLAGHVQAGFCAPPENILGRARPLVFLEVEDLAPAKAAAKA